MDVGNKISGVDVLEKVIQSTNVTESVFDYEPEDLSVGIYSGLFFHITFSYDNIFNNVVLPSHVVDSKMDYIKKIVAEVVSANDKDKHVSQYIFYPNEDLETVKKSVDEMAKYMNIDGISFHKDEKVICIKVEGSC